MSFVAVNFEDFGSQLAVYWQPLGGITIETGIREMPGIRPWKLTGI